jgi:hypothetical protein
VRTVAVHDEGDGLLGVYVAPCDARGAARAARALGPITPSDAADVLADPHTACASAPALALSDDGHLAVYVRDPHLARATLSAIADSLPDEAAARLAQPIADDEWHEVEHRAHDRFREIRVLRRTVAGRSVVTLDETRFVARGHGAWRAGWTW